jgi:hypothetical protein
MAMRKAWVILGTLLLIGCGGGSIQMPTGAPPSTTAAIQTSTATEVTLNRRVAPATGGTMAVTVFVVRTIDGTQARTVALDIGMENLDTQERRGFAPFRFKLQTTDDRRYDPTDTTMPTPQLGSGYVPPAGRVRGWLTFALPLTAVLSSLQWSGDFSKDVIVPLA